MERKANVTGKEPIEEKPGSSTDRYSARYPALFNALTQPLSTVTSRYYQSVTEPFSESFVRTSDYKYVKEKILYPWLTQYPRVELLSRHIIYKPNSGDYANTVPEDQYVRIRPKSEHNLVQYLTTYQNFILLGMGLGQVILYNLKEMTLIRTYQVHHSFGVRQIVVGKKVDRFFVIAFDTFMEFSYYDGLPRYKFTDQTVIKAILAVSNPMLIINIEGFVSEYSNEDSETKVSPIGKLFDNISYIEELKSYDPYINERTRPCLVRNKCCIAIINLTLSSEPKLSVFRKELLTTNPEEGVLICCNEEKYFYSIIPQIMAPCVSTIYVSRFNDMGYVNRIEMIRCIDAFLNMRTTENFLLVMNRIQKIEVFDVRSNVKKYQISFGQYINTSIIVKNKLIVGTHDSSLIIQDMSLIRDEICKHCGTPFDFENIGVFKRCIHFIPYENSIQSIN